MHDLHVSSVESAANGVQASPQHVYDLAQTLTSQRETPEQHLAPHSRFHRPTNGSTMLHRDTKRQRSSRTCCVLTGALDLGFFEKPAQLNLGRLGLGTVLGSHCKGWTGRTFMDPYTCSLPHRGVCCWLQHAHFSEKDCHTMKL